MLLEGASRGDDGVALHLEGIQREGNASMIVGMTAARSTGVIERILMNIQITIARDAGDMG